MQYFFNIEEYLKAEQCYQREKGMEIFTRFKD